MKIKMVEDLGAPLAVTAVDLVTQETAPDWNEWASYIMAGGGYAGALMNFGGEFVKNVGIASLPLAARNIYARIKGGSAKMASSRLAFRPAQKVSGIRQTVTPEFEDVRVS